jgi:hypothetical protein
MLRMILKMVSLVFLFFVAVLAEDSQSQADDPLRCLEAKKVGECRALIPSYFYDTTTKQCKRFGYGGCHGNRNRWDKKEDCERVCQMWIKGQEMSDGTRKQILDKSEKKEEKQYPPFPSKVNPKYMNDGQKIPTALP